MKRFFYCLFIVSFIFSLDHSLFFDGSDKINIPDQSHLDITTTGTISAWIKPSTLTQETYANIVAKTHNGDLGGDYEGLSYYIVWRQGSGVIRGQICDGVNTSNVSMDLLNDYNWHHIAFTWDETNLKIYLDGNLQSTTEQTITGAQSTDYDLKIGGDAYGWDDSGNGEFKGNIDEVQVWNRALSQSEINDKMIVDSGSNEDGLVGNWKFDYYDPYYPNVVYDYSTYANNGTNTGATYSDDIPCGVHSDCDTGDFCSSLNVCQTFDWDYCINNVCYEGDGDCDGGQCATGFTCGTDNCNYGNGIDSTADCCVCIDSNNNGFCDIDEDNCSAHSDCNDGQFCSYFGICTTIYDEYCHDNICYEGEGDCDDGIVGGTDSNGCADGLACGVDNCDFGSSGYDCCCLDTDGDSVCNSDEIAGCIDTNACNYNANATDSSDTCVFATGCDSCSGETDGSGTVVDGDADDDTVCDAIDNCLNDANTNQTNNDGDLSGDICDEDDDNDGVFDSNDCAPLDSSAAIIDDCSVCGGNNSTCIPCETDNDCDNQWCYETNQGHSECRPYTEEGETCLSLFNQCSPGLVCFSENMIGDQQLMDAYGLCVDPVGCTDEAACNYTIISHNNNEFVPTQDDGSCLYDDCAGNCDGTAAIDDCNDCVGGNTGITFNSAMDCVGVCNGDGSTNNYPYLSLLGDIVIEYFVGELDIYIDLGGICNDVEMGDISDAIITSGDYVDINTEGVYFVDLICTDDCGDSTTETRVIVITECDYENDIDCDGIGNPMDICFGDNSYGDTDNDGDCDDVDTDDDGDGIEDNQDICLGSINVDYDNDGLCDDIDPDIDNDNVVNEIDICLGNDNLGDTDNDGYCDDVDTDDDGDGVLDGVDVCTGDDASGDEDNDGTCNDIDSDFNDADGDGIIDSEDICFGENDTGNFDDDTECNDFDMDDDNDGVLDDDDPCLGLLGSPGNFWMFEEDWVFNEDFDSDGICDADDSDMDGDGIPDEGFYLSCWGPSSGYCNYLNIEFDVCLGAANIAAGSYEFSNSDFDGDNLCDDIDPDIDNDGLLNEVDNCIGMYDVNNEYMLQFWNDDYDGDGICDDSDEDLDGDGVLNYNNDNGTSDCIGYPNIDFDNDNDCDSDDDDDDGDGVLDDLDLCLGFPNEDFDGDGICDGIDDNVDGDFYLNDDDPCLGVSNEDFDSDGQCDEVDDDYDGDGVLNDLDSCLGFPNEDFDGDGICDGIDDNIDGDSYLNDDDLCLGVSNEDFDSDGQCDEVDDDDDDDNVLDINDICMGLSGITDTIIDDDQIEVDNPDWSNEDFDGDGLCDDLDDDDDGDLIADDVDTCFGIANIITGTFDWSNSDWDQDGLCDDFDTDDDNDELLDDVDPCLGSPTAGSDHSWYNIDYDGDGICNQYDEDIDGDGIVDVDETGDTDDQCIGDNSTGNFDNDDECNDFDMDDDNDGISDDIDPCLGSSNPAINLFNVDFDGDSLCDNLDTDDDNDGISDSSDTCLGLPNVYSSSNSAWTDSDWDSDNLCDDVDNDDDNDNISDNADVCLGNNIPISNINDLDNDNENDSDILIIDLDGDGICDSADTDDDGDGVNDSSDNCIGLPNIISGELSWNNDDYDNDGLCDDLDQNDDNDMLVDDDDLCNGDEINDDGYGHPDYADWDGDNLCNDVDEDDDNDGINDSIDQCLGLENTSNWDNDQLCDDADLDIDNDGVLNDEDMCIGDWYYGDFDEDGICDDVDDDDDGDGLHDSDPTQVEGETIMDFCLGALNIEYFLDDWVNTDFDGDGICDDIDGDLDNDDIPNEDDFCLGINEPYHITNSYYNIFNDLDFDFNNDNETMIIDLDEDGICDTSDEDIDGDLIDDDDDNCFGLPNIISGSPTWNNDDFDDDGLCDDLDQNDDNDMLSDDEDLCSGAGNDGMNNTNNDDLDTDSDGICDSHDDDDDDDGILDSSDTCLGDNSSGDDDWDGYCNNLDIDIDGDSILDINDICLGLPAITSTISAGLDDEGVPIYEDNPDWSNEDFDGDGLCDDLDDDVDGDLVDDDIDNCIGIANIITGTFDWSNSDWDQDDSCDDLDDDDDNDEILDDVDICLGSPTAGSNDPWYNIDLDNDGICNSYDDDLDGDGILNDDGAGNTDQCIGNNSTGNFDNDSECNDIDLDDDNDGFSDDIDPCLGSSNPEVELFNVDFDGDSICDNFDDNADGDIYLDVDDPCFGVSNVDFDSDDLCDDLDDDDDNDTILDIDDSCLGNPNIDFDNDGLCDNLDTDDDNDTILDGDDECLGDNQISLYSINGFCNGMADNDCFGLYTSVMVSPFDFDGDGLCNNIDNDNDNDGLIDFEENFVVVENQTTTVIDYCLGNFNTVFSHSESVLTNFNWDQSDVHWNNVDFDGNGICNDLDVDPPNCYGNDNISDYSYDFSDDNNTVNGPYWDIDNDGLCNDVDNDDDNDGLIDFGETIINGPDDFASGCSNCYMPSAYNSLQSFTSENYGVFYDNCIGFIDNVYFESDINNWINTDFDMDWVCDTSDNDIDGDELIDFSGSYGMYDEEECTDLNYDTTHPYNSFICDTCMGDNSSLDFDHDFICSDVDDDDDGDNILDEFDLCIGLGGVTNTIFILDDDTEDDPNDMIEVDNPNWSDEDFDFDGLCDDLDDDDDNDLVLDDDDSCLGENSSGDSDGDGICNDSDDISCEGYSCHPRLVSAEDIPNDQGGRVYITFESSSADTGSLNRDVEFYTIERLDSPDGAPVTDVDSIYNIWVSVGMTSAYGEEEYTVEATTLFNATENQEGITYFRVIASMDEGVFASDIAEGSSIDNLAPSIPGDLNHTYIENDIYIEWSEPVDVDFLTFDVYANNEFIATTTDNNFTHVAPGYDAIIGYSIMATDLNYNDSDLSEILSVNLPIIGDTNYSFDINVSDLVMLVNFILEGIYNPIGDVNGDGFLNVSDVVALVNIILDD